MTKHHLNMGITKLVEITREPKPNDWYAGMVGETFWVYDFDSSTYILKDDFDAELQARRLLDMGDCQKLQVIDETPRYATGW